MGCGSWLASFVDKGWLLEDEAQSFDDNLSRDRILHHEGHVSRGRYFAVPVIAGSPFKSHGLLYPVPHAHLLLLVGCVMRRAD